MLAANMADIVFAIDESGSAAETSAQAWVARMIAGDAGNGVASLATQLASDGIDDVRYGLVGFGENVQGNPPLPRYAHSQLFDPVGGDPDSLFGDPTSATSSGPNDPYVNTAALDVVFGTQGSGGNLAQFGGDEDGWDAIEHAIAEYQFRDGAAAVPAEHGSLALAV